MIMTQILVTVTPAQPGQRGDSTLMMRLGLTVMIVLSESSSD